ncbi:beta-glucosidase H [Coraliomargarita parva]|uniref:beta-glucosidase H n=1 Tax=Coraliomargarita parva TaxID=3014050 RepID=UPI0022B57638|nr:glycoside hydrolase family 3 C-terminal domain-containing protein [Coraliomargarita parva]
MTDRHSDVAEFVEATLGKLTLEEKVSLCHAGSKFGIAGVPRLGIPAFEMSDGPHGVRHEISKTSWEPAGCDDDYSTYLPCGSAQASTWNRDAMARCGAVLGAEARHRGKDVILGPGVNLIRTPLCGRNFEYYSEDPYLTSELVVPAIRSIQEQDVAACVKHFAANNQEWNRGETDVVVDEATLREMYLPAFRAAVLRGGVYTVMGAYNKFRGQHCCHNDYLVNRILKEEWGFDGAYISDWAGVHSTDEAVICGLDIEMGTSRPFEEFYLAQPYLEGLRSGQYDVDGLDDKVRRVLRVMYRCGVFDPERSHGARNTREHQQTALEVAREAIVLLKNEAGILPLDSNKIRKLAVIGENAEILHAAGGNSSGVKSLYEVSPLEGLRRYLGEDVEIIYAQGYPDNSHGLEAIPTQHLFTADPGSGVKGWKAYYQHGRSFEGEPLFQYAENASYEKLYDTPPAGFSEQNFSVTWETELTVPDVGEYRFGFETDGIVELWLDGQLVCRTESDACRFVERIERVLAAGQIVQIQVRHQRSDNATYVRFGWQLPQDKFSNGKGSFSPKDEAIRIARSADAVVFFGGLNHMHDIEGRDRKDLKLPDGQDALIAALLEVRPDAVICLITGSAVEMPWLDQVQSLVWTSFSGLEGGNAIAETLFGSVNPSGRLPFTFPNCLNELPPHNGLGSYAADCSRYDEGMLVGYRYYSAMNKRPLFCFGYGLSYTEFELSDLCCTEGREDVSFEVDVTNVGSVVGQAVIQLYLEKNSGRSIVSGIKLRGFEKLELQPGESRTVLFSLTEEDLSYFSQELGQWITDIGDYHVLFGFSSEELPLQAQFRWEPSALGESFVSAD